MLSQLTLVHAFTPLHAGIGQGAGVIDLPIAREKATGLPFLPGSSIKGALRTRLLQEVALEKYKDIFGSDPGALEQMRASSVLFSDQRVLLLPVRSIAGTFAWVTAPYVLHRFVRDLAEAQEKPEKLDIPQIDPRQGGDTKQVEAAGRCLITNESKLRPTKESKVYLEDFDLQASDNGQLTTWADWLSAKIFSGSGQEQEAWQRMFKERLCLVHDDLFHFMCQHSTEITARIRLEEESKTVKGGALWYEEALPAETILSGIAVITPVKAIKLSAAEIADGLKELTQKTLQFGGKATVGRGMCQVQLV